MRIYISNMVIRIYNVLWCNTHYTRQRAGHERATRWQVLSHVSGPADAGKLVYIYTYYIYVCVLAVVYCVYVYICIHRRVRYTCNHKNNHENQKQSSGQGSRRAWTITFLVEDNHNVYVKGKPQQQQQRRQQRIRWLQSLVPEARSERYGKRRERKRLYDEFIRASIYAQRRELAAHSGYVTIN